MKRLMVLGFVALPLSACTPEKAEAPQKTGMANPAAVFCVEQGGRLALVTSAQGATGLCHLPDGRVVEEWEFFRAHHKP